MPRWRDDVRRRLPLRGVDPLRAEEIVEEIAEQLEETYAEALRDGADDAEARARAEAQVPDWDRLGLDLGDRSPRAWLREGDSRTRVTRALAGPGWLADGCSDLLYGMRRLRRELGFTVLAVVTLGLAIGLNTAVFSLVNALLFRPLPAHEPERLASVWNFAPDSFVSHQPMAYADYADLRDGSQSFEALAAYAMTPLALESGESSEMVMGEIVTENYFEMLGTRPALGRLLSSTDGTERGADPFAVLSYQCWQRRFAGDPSVIGRRLRVNGHALTVIGVAPRGFAGLLLGMSPQLWVPMMMEPTLRATATVSSSEGSSLGESRLDRRSVRWLWVIGRLAPGTSVAEADTELHVLGQRLRELYPDTNEEREVAVLPASDVRLIPGVDTVLYGTSGVLMGVVGLVLLIASSNVANMLLARGAARGKEFAVRLAIGCGRGRLVRQLLAESLLLAALASALGLGLAWSSNIALNALRLPLPVQIALGLALDTRVLGFTLFLTVVTAVAFGLLPALRAAHQDPAPTLKGEAEAGAGRTRQTLTGSLVVAQVALSLVLLIAAGLSVRSLARARDIDPGFDPRGVVRAQLSPSLQGYTIEQAEPMYAELLARLRRVPGVVAVGTASHLPLSFEINVEGLAAEGQEPGKTRSWPMVDAASVGPGYFETLGIPLLRGRPFDARDVHGTRRIAIVNETLARRFWPEEDPIGRRVRFEDEDELWTVVGVARDGRYRTLGEAPRPFLYRPIAQVGQVDRVILVKHTGVASLVLAAVRDDARQVAERVPLVGLGTLQDALAMTLLLPRSGAALFGLLGLLGLVLACAGLYGVIAYSVSRRTREIGIRMALGASRARVLTLVVSGGLRLVAVGLGLGLLLAAGASRALEAVLYGVSPTDGTTFTVVSSLLIVTAVLACLVPARRASRMDPMRALRCE